MWLKNWIELILSYIEPLFLKSTTLALPGANLLKRLPNRLRLEVYLMVSPYMR